jgi:signal transduction histidine kinase
MIRSLQRRLAALLIAVISLILVVTSGAALIVSESQLSLREQAGFDAQLSALARDIAVSGSVLNAQLAKLEAANHLLLTIYDNGQALTFPGGWQMVTPRGELITHALSLAGAQGVTVDAGTGGGWRGAFYGARGERYLAAIQPIDAYRSRQVILMLKDMRQEDAQRANQRWLFAGITLTALIALSAFGWFFTRRAVRPIQAAFGQQNAFVAAASHELRTPLQVMRSGLDALKGGPPDAGRFLTQMQDEVSRMSALAGDLMILTSARGNVRERFGPVEMEVLAEEAVSGYQAAAFGKQISLTFDKPAKPLPVVEGDAPLLMRAINVLIDNAVCYTQEGGHILVTATHDARQLSLSVEDDGPGIAPDHRTRIFERFYRADMSRSDKRHSGLGLAIAWEIVHQHGGSLTYRPLSPHGSRFDLILPPVPQRARRFPSQKMNWI